MTAARRAVFLDRDGTLVRDHRHSADGALIEFLPGVSEALRALRGAGYLLVVATNQSGVARGLFTLSEARAAGARLASLARGVGAPLDGYYLCPDHPDGAVAQHRRASAGRKPEPGMLVRAGSDLDIDFDASWMIGDQPSDAAAGASAGTRCILLDTGGWAWNHAAGIRPRGGLLVARNVAHAAAIILSEPDAGLGGMPPILASRWAPLSPADLEMAPPPPRDDRSTGQPCRWPDAARVLAAEQDGRALAHWLTGRAVPPAAPGARGET